MIVYILKEEDDQTGELRITGVFSKKSQAEKAHEEYDNLFNNRYPIKWDIEEHEINYHVWKLKSHFDIEI